MVNGTENEIDEKMNTGDVARETARQLKVLLKRVAAIEENTKPIPELCQRVEKIEKNTRSLPGFIEKIRNALSKFVGDMDKDVMR